MTGWKRTSKYGAFRFYIGSLRRLVSGQMRCLRSPNLELALDRSISDMPEGDNIK